MTVVSFNTEATIHIPADDDGVTQSTFYHHDGKSKSQIDYIIANDDVIESITFFDQDHLNSSTHRSWSVVCLNFLDIGYQNSPFWLEGIH
jgi:hypothetical protein